MHPKNIPIMSPHFHYVVTRNILTASLVVLVSWLHAQQFWLTTYEFPGGAKTAIALKGDSTLFVATAAGITRSYDQAYKFDTCFTNPNIFALYITANQNILAGGVGKIYRSTNNGQTWDSAMLNNSFGVIKILQLPNGHLFAITAALSGNFTGGGIYYSDNDGQTWVQRNNGLGNYLYLDGLTSDNNNRVYVTAADEYSTGNAGLFYSDNEGQLWNHVPIVFDGQNAVNDNLQVTVTRGLTVAPNDTLYFSFEGVADNTAVQVNLCKHINDVTGSAKWVQNKISNSNMFWMDKVLGNIHTAHNGDWYSSNANTISTGGTFFRKANTPNWQRHDEGLGLDIYQRRNWHQYVETSAGRIFMIQNLDERIYVTDTSRYTPTGLHDIQTPIEATVYPNPVSAGNKINITTTVGTNETALLIDITGRAIATYNMAETGPTISTPDKSGVYILQVVTNKGVSSKRLIVL